MKRTILVFAALLAGMSAAPAQDGGAKQVTKDGGGVPAPLSKSRVPGIYQRCGIVRDAGGDTKFMMNPFLKIYNPDGTFYTVLAMPQRTLPAIITTSGSYRVLSDHQLVESLGESIYDSHRAGEDNAIIYTIRGDSMSFLFPSGGGVGREAWYTVCRPAAAKAKRTPLRARALAESLEGVWQLCYHTDDGRYVYAPIYKIYRTDGTFVTVNMTSQDGAARVAAHGSYAAQEPDKYVECVSESAANPELEGVDTSFECIFTDDDGRFLQVTFSLPGREGAFTEQWARVIGTGGKRKTPSTGM